jgi:hypothetical protein
MLESERRPTAMTVSRIISDRVTTSAKPGRFDALNALARVGLRDFGVRELWFIAMGWVSSGKM